MKVISIATQKGGVGKTTTALELAAIFKLEYERRVLLIDFDQQRNLTKYVGEEESTASTIYTALKKPEKIKDCIRKLEDFDFIPGSEEVSNIDIEFKGSEDVFALDDVIDQIKTDYDIIIIDNGPNRNKALQMVYVASDYVICPTDDTEGGSDGLVYVNNDINRMKNTKIPLSQAVIIGSIITKYKKNTTLNKAALDILKSVMQEINPRGFVLPVRDSVRVSETKFARQSLQRFDKYNNAAMDYRAIAKAIVKYMEEDNE